MPTIDVYTAQARTPTINAPKVSPDSFGGNIGGSLQQLGNQFLAIDQRLKDQQDRLDIAMMAAEYDQKIDAAKSQIATTQDIAQHGKLLQDQHKTILSELNEGAYSETAKKAFLVHATGQYANHAIDLAHTGRRIMAERQVANFQKQSEFLIDQAASARTAIERDRFLGIQKDLHAGMVQNGLLDPSQALQHEQHLRDRYWEQRARLSPQEVLFLAAEGKPVEGMDNAKMTHYSNIAVGVINARDKQQEREVKQLQEANEATVMSDVLSGQALDVAGTLSEMVRSRGLDSKSASFLMAVEKTIRERQGQVAQVPGLAQKLESELSGMKYSPGVTSKSVTLKRAQILAEFNAGHIGEDDFKHLMAVWRGTFDWVNRDDTDGVSRNVSHAHSNLMGDLRTVGPMGFDGLAEATRAEAERYFYAEMDKNPKANPWDIAKKAREIFKPVLEERQRLAETDKSRLDNAKVDALKELGAISPAAHRAWKEQDQENQGQRIVDEALKNLPPPVEPSLWDRILNMFNGKEGEAPKRKKAR